VRAAWTGTNADEQLGLLAPSRLPASNVRQEAFRPNRRVHDNPGLLSSHAARRRTRGHRDHVTQDFRSGLRAGMRGIP